jgi:hypothetical protein
MLLALGPAALALAAAVSIPAARAAAPQFAPGVLTTIEPELDRTDALSQHDVVEIRASEKLKWQPHSLPASRTLFEMASQAAYPQRVWCLELSFKPLRMIEVDVPQASGRLERKLVWYMVYRVRNTGAVLDPQIAADGTFETKAGKAEPVRFLPEFVLASQDVDAAGDKVRKAYLDRLVPAAMEPIRRRELPEGQLLDSVAMTKHPLAVESGRIERGVWGVATWENVDPAIDFFSIYVGGLSNALQWTDPPGAYKAGDPPGKGRKFVHKTLQLNFWRPGDELDQNEREIRYGVAPGKAALYDSTEGVAYRWVFR